MLYIAGLLGIIAVLAVSISKKHRWLISSYLFSCISYVSSFGDKDRYKDKLEDEEEGFSPHFDPFISTHRQQELYRAYDNNSELRLRQHGSSFSPGMMDVPMQNYQNNQSFSLSAPLPRPFEGSIPSPQLSGHIGYYSAPPNVGVNNLDGECVQQPSSSYHPLPHMNSSTNMNMGTNFKGFDRCNAPSLHPTFPPHPTPPPQYQTLITPDGLHASAPDRALQHEGSHNLTAALYPLPTGYSTQPPTSYVNNASMVNNASAGNAAYNKTAPNNTPPIAPPQASPLLQRSSPLIRPHTKQIVDSIGIKNEKLPGLLPSPIKIDAMKSPPPPPPPVFHATSDIVGNNGSSADFASENSNASPSRHVGSQMVLLSLKDLSLTTILGGGAFGQVWKGSWRGTPVAVKVLSSAIQSKIPEKEIKSFEDEVNMLASLRHPNICLFMGACLEPANRAIVTELVSRGSLWDALRAPIEKLFSAHQGPVFWPWWAVRKVLDGTLKGLLYLHCNTPPIIHRDLKSANLLLDDAFNVKICDFGLAKLRDMSNNVPMTANVGTLQWMAPEVIQGKSYSESADVFSLGMIVWELLTGKYPFEGLGQLEIAHQVVTLNVRPDIPSFLQTSAPQLVNFLRSCWDPIPEKRITADEALKLLGSVIPH